MPARVPNPALDLPVQTTYEAAYRGGVDQAVLDVACRRAATRQIAGAR